MRVDNAGFKTEGANIFCDKFDGERQVVIFCYRYAADTTVEKILMHPIFQWIHCTCTKCSTLSLTVQKKIFNLLAVKSCLSAGKEPNFLCEETF